MKTRRIGPFEVSAVGLGCMNLSHAYGTPPSREDAAAVLRAALAGGVTLFDTAALYGFGANEELLGEVLAHHRERIVLTTKCGMHGVDGRRVIDGRPQTLRASCDASLRRLRTDVIDVLYLHRLDPQVPVEDSIGAMADLVRTGKVKALGLSEVSALTLRRAHRVYPIAALQSEYSLWTRNPEIAVLNACQEMGIAFVAFSPLARGFLGGLLRDVGSLAANDIRRGMPRFSPENYRANLALLDDFESEAAQLQCTPATLALAWLLRQGDHIIPIPGTSQRDHLWALIEASRVELSDETAARIGQAFHRRAVRGARYNAATQAEIDTEEF